MVHIVTKGSSEPGLSIPVISILRNHIKPVLQDHLRQLLPPAEPLGHVPGPVAGLLSQVRVRGPSTCKVRVYAVGSLLTSVV